MVAPCDTACQAVVVVVVLKGLIAHASNTVRRFT